MSLRSSPFPRKCLSLVLALALFALAFALEFHRHDDAAVHPDCSICAAVLQAQYASLQHQETGSPVVAESLCDLPGERPAPIALHLEVPVIRPPPA